MPKLFVALELPAVVTAELVKIQPPKMAGVRLVAPSQMHVTLHFLGEGDIARISAALQELSASVIGLEIEGVGRFQSAAGAITMWAGVKKNAELLALHAAVGTMLSAKGFQPETRYNPHVTIARCEPAVPAGILTDFIEKQSSFSLPRVTISEFAVYSSVFVQDAPEYNREGTFRLNSAN
jgi:2'-5' RNA ligase